MNKRLSRKFTLSFFVTLVEMSLYHAFVILFISDVKSVSNVYITRMVAINFIVSLIITPLFGELIEKIKDKALLVRLSTFIYIISISFLFIFDTSFMILFGNILYNISKSLIIRLQEMFGAQAHYEKRIDFGETRSSAALAYAFSPLLVTIILELLRINKHMYVIVFTIMIVMIIFNTVAMNQISNEVELPTRDQSTSFIESLKSISKDTWFYLSFIIISNVFYNSTNSFVVTFQSIYFQEIFNATKYLGLVILIGSILEWPFMKKTNKIIQKVGYIRSFMLLAILQIVRWTLYFIAGLQQNITIFFIAASLNGVLQAIYIPLFTTFVREISTDETYGNNITIIGFIGSLLMWSITQIISVVQKARSLQDMFMFLNIITFAWLLIMFLYELKISKKNNID